MRPLTDIERRFCFEIISPTKSHVLQADSELQYKLWLATLQQGISSALHQEISREEDSQAGIQWEDSDTEEAQDSKAKMAAQKKVRSAEQILVIPGNEVCADCGAVDPQWASINWGVVLCIECGGIHRSLGVHITKVRGIRLDVWEPEILKVMAELGNNIVNMVLESQLEGRQKPGSESSRGEKEEWIRHKYQHKTFVNREVFNSKEVEEAEAWTVKRLRRRARSGKKCKTKEQEEVSSDDDVNSVKESLDKDDKDIDTSQEEAEDSSLLESVLRASTLAVGSVSWLESQPEKIQVLNAEVCLFGGSLGKHHVSSVELDSDQESTDGEGEGEGEDKSGWAPPHDPLTQLSPNMLLYRAARAHNLPVMLQALALGANPEWRCGAEGEKSRSSIHQSIMSGSVMATEFLILNSVKTLTADGEGNTALHLASSLGNTGQVCLLLKHRADHHKRNYEGERER